MPRLNHYGCKNEYGCPKCGIWDQYWGNMKLHMVECCPDYFDKYTTGEMRQTYCNLASINCLVPNHEDWKTQKRKECDERKKMKKKVQKVQKHVSEWRAHDKKLEGGVYDASAEIEMEAALIDKVRACLEKEFEKDPSGPYGVQGAMGTKEDWIHWGLSLACHPSRTRRIFDEYQDDVKLNIAKLDRLGMQLREGYQGSPAYVGALHCIFQDTFRRCQLPYPPLLNLDAAMYIRSDGAENKSRMRSFNGYKYRAFGIVQAVVDSLDGTNDVESLDITPPKLRN